MKKILVLLFLLSSLIPALGYSLEVFWETDPTYIQQFVQRRGPYTMDYIRANYTNGTYSAYVTKTNASLYIVLTTNFVPLATCKLYYGPATRQYTNTLTVGLTNRAIITNLTDTVFMAVTAVDIYGLESDFGDEAKFPESVTNQLHMIRSKIYPDISFLGLQPIPGKDYKMLISQDLEHWSLFHEFGSTNGYIYLVVTNVGSRGFFRTVAQ